MVSFKHFWARLFFFFFFKSQSRKRPFSLSRSLPEIQTSSQKTASHPIHSARVSALGQEIPEPFRLYKNLQNWFEKPPKIWRNNLESLRLKLVWLFPSRGNDSEKSFLSSENSIPVGLPKLPRGLTADSF